MSDDKQLWWKRPDDIEYPKIWHTFKAKDIDSDDLVEYRIEDLAENQFEDALDFVTEIFCKDEPICQAYGTLNFHFYFLSLKNEIKIQSGFSRGIQRFGGH